MDGKQARRTKSSSPLGLLMDHGTDALTTFFFTQSLGSIIGLSKLNHHIIDNIEYFSIIWLMASIPFFLNTWEEYYTGELNLPVFHGVSEGTVVACIAMNVAGFFGRSFWTTEIQVFNTVLKYNELATLFCFISGVLFGFLSVINVLIKFKDRRQDAFTNLFLFIFLCLSLCIVIKYANSTIIIEYPKIVLYVYGFAFAKLVGHLQLAHVADAKFMQFRRSLMSTFLFLALFSLSNYYGYTKINIDYLIVGSLILHIIGIL